MTPDQIDTYANAVQALQSDTEAILALADQLRVAIDTVFQRLTAVHRATSVLRRTDQRDVMGALNSVSAANARQQSLGGNLRELEACLSNFENTYRDLRLLHPEVVAALRERLAAVTATPAQAGTSGASEAV